MTRIQSAAGNKFSNGGVEFHTKSTIPEGVGWYNPYTKYLVLQCQ
jgi:hypothetical protein